ncbi:hypothetical protein FRC0426_01990 [Corynebacterium diphtheriae]|nr:hypothetical protein FRC0426_01990 [Corynebacterium diphtheriae]
MSKPSVQTKDLLCRPTEMSSSTPSAAPQNMVIVTIIEAEPIEPINECPTCGQPSKTMNKRRKDILAYFDTKSMPSKTGRATKRGYFEAFFFGTSHQIASKPAV